MSRLEALLFLTALLLWPQTRTIRVASDRTGDFSSVQSAADAAEPGSVILIAPGTYRETVRITKPNVRMQGTGADPSDTVIVFDNSAGSTGSTFRSATVEVRGDAFHAENLTFANDFNARHSQLAQGSQALALWVNADRAVFRRVRLLGNQDTVYAASKNCNPDGNPCLLARQYFADCYIEGNIDFIFGDGKAVFERCEIHSTEHNSGYITAQGKHYPDEDSGFVFRHCKLTAASGVTGVWLGRPWRRYASVVFLDTEMGGHIAPAGWREWHPGETNFIETVYYAEFHSAGPGAHAQDRDPHMKRLTASEAAQFETKRFLAGSDHWDPARDR